MKNILSYVLLVLCNIIFAQSLPITTNNNLKITSPVHGSIQDSLLVWRGSGDKIVRFLPSSYFASKDYVDKKVNFLFNNIQIPFSTQPIISPSTGEDELIREVGNRIYDPNTNQHIIVYSGSLNPYTGDNVFVYYATSVDGVSWTKQGKLIASNNEDPYLQIIGNQYRLYAEKKSPSNINDGIELFTGTTLAGMTSQGLILVGTVGEWDEQDDSSPLPLFKDGMHYLYFEGRNGTSNAGAIGVATSIDGLTYTKNPSNPIIKGSQLGNNTWFTHCVTDDIIELNGKYHMTVHAWNGDTFVCGIFETNNDNINDNIWHDTLNTWLTIDQTNDDKGAIMLYNDKGTIYTYNGDADNSMGIYQGILNVRASDKIWTSTKTSASLSTYTALSPCSRNQIVHAPIVSNKIFEIKNDESCKGNAYKLIHNDSSFILYIDPDTGVTINGNTTNIIIPAGRKLYMYLTNVNTWTAYILQSDSDISNWDNVYNNRNNYLRNQADGTVGNILGATTITDANNLLTGMAWMIGSVANLPSTTSYHVLSMSGIANYNAQLAIRNNAFWFRTQENTTWQGWNQLASTAYADAKVTNNLTASTTIAPSKTAVNTALALKLDSSSILSGSATLDFSSTALGTSSELTITVTGATDGDVVSLGVPNVSSNANSCFTARVSATNTVTVKFNNYSSGAIDPASGTFKVKVFK